MKGMKSHMNHPSRRDCNLHSPARAGSTASVPAKQVSTERKSLWRNQTGAFLALGLSFVIVGVIAGCGSSSANPAQQTPLISVAITQLPPSSMIAGNSAMVSATVINDPANAGVDWVATCASAPNCGTFTPSHTVTGGT